MSGSVEYHRGAELPALRLWLFDDAGSLINFASGYTFAFNLGVPGATPVLQKSGGIAGAAGSGTAPSGTPNVVITWSADELDVLPGPYVWELVATASGLSRVFSGRFRVLSVLV